MTKDERIAELRQENEQLKKELAEKDEELKGLRIVKEVDEATKNGLRKTVDLLYDSLKTNHDKFEKNLRHEICEKIRNKATFDDSDPFFYRPIYHITPKLLDQIERGEE